MATRTLNAAEFTAKLLAPLPADAEAIDSKAFRRALHDDMKVVWDRGRYRLNIAQADKKAAFYRYMLADRSADSEATERAHVPIVHEAHRNLMLTPAPGMTQLSWKRAEIGHHSNDDAVRAAIAADEARLAPKQEA